MVCGFNVQLDYLTQESVALFRNYNERNIRNIQTPKSNFFFRPSVRSRRPTTWTRVCAQLSSSSSGESSEAFYPPLSHIQAAPDPSAMSLSVTPAAERGEQFGFYRNIAGQSWWKSGLKAVEVHLKESRSCPRSFFLPLRPFPLFPL